MGQQEQALSELTEKFLKDFFSICSNETESYVFGYIFPEILAKCAPHNLDTEFSFPYIGMGFGEQILQQFFKKYVQKIPIKLQRIIEQYPRDYRDERWRLQDWVEDIVEVEHADSEYVDGKYTFKGFKPFPVLRISFVYNQVNSGVKTQVECIYSNNKTPTIETINLYTESGDLMISIRCYMYDEVNPERIRGYEHIRSVNSTLSAINFIFQEIESGAKFED